MNWDSARRHARALETALDAKLTNYSRVASAIANGQSTSTSASSSSSPLGGGGSSGERQDEDEGGYRLIEEEIEELVGKLEQAIDDMTVLINSPSQPPSASMQHGAQRHRDNLDDYRREFFRIRKNVEAALARRNLLGSVRQDIRSVRVKLGAVIGVALQRPGDGRADGPLKVEERTGSSV
jgi:Golgi SNAP receptor complex protein 1